MVLITEKIILINPVDRINGSRPLRFASGTALFFAGGDNRTEGAPAEDFYIKAAAYGLSTDFYREKRRMRRFPFVFYHDGRFDCERARRLRARLPCALHGSRSAACRRTGCLRAFL